MSGTVSFQIVHGDQRHTFECFDTMASQSICKEILTGKTYKSVPFAGDVGTVVDVGANVGAASLYFALTYPAASIHAFEPDPTSFAVLERNCEKFPRIQVENVGLFSTDCRRVLYRSTYDSVTASVGKSRLNSDIGDEIILRDARAALSIANMSPIDILKIDTEGCEVPILYSAINIVRKARVIYLEYHSEWDRKTIDLLLSDTHILCSGTVLSPHRGEFCYVLRNAFPSAEELSWFEIKI